MVMSIDNISCKKYKRIRVVLYIFLGFIISVATIFNAITGLAVYYDNFVPKKYTASSMILVKGNPDVYENSSEANIASNNNLAVILSYSEQIQKLIPSTYSVSIKPAEDYGVFSITVTGSDPKLCADTVNNLRDVSLTVFKEYYSEGELVPYGNPATVPKYPSSFPSVWFFIIISAVIFSIMTGVYIVIVVFIEKMFRKELKVQCIQ